MDNCDLNQLSISSRRIFLYLKCYYKIKKKVSTQNINIEKIRLVILYIYIYKIESIIQFILYN